MYEPANFPPSSGWLGFPVEDCRVYGRVPGQTSPAMVVLAGQPTHLPLFSWIFRLSRLPLPIASSDGGAVRTSRALFRCVAMERRIAELEARVRQLEAMLLEATRASKRQASPSSQNNPKLKPKKPGSPMSHARAHRPAPPPESITQTIDTPLAGHCPDCGAA